MTAPSLLRFFFFFCSSTRLFCNISFGCFYESLSTLSTLQFYFLITTVHQAGFHLERAALCQTYNLIHQRPVRQLFMRHTPPVSPAPCRSTPCHSSGLSCGNIQHHCQSVSACVSKITLSRTPSDVSSLSLHLMCDSRLTDTHLLDIDFSNTHFRDRQEGASYPPLASRWEGWLTKAMPAKSRQMAGNILFAVLACLLIYTLTKSLLITEFRGEDRPVCYAD